MCTEKRAVALAGGGSLGSYELGAWKALREVGFEANLVVGTSIGSINAALYAQRDYALAEHLWDNISVGQVMENGINMELSLDTLLSQRGELRPFLRKYAQCRGADISPLIALLQKVIDEERVRSSHIDMGLVTVRFPSLTPMEFMLHDIPKGLLVDFLLASAACFPAFPMHKIGSESYIDGGYYDNMPVNLAIAQGAEEIVAIDLRPITKSSLLHFSRMPQITYVAPRRTLGSILLFDQRVIQRNKRLGYSDTLKAFGRLQGFAYSFRPDGLAEVRPAARRFACLLARCQQQFDPRKRIAMDPRMPLSECMEEETDGRPLSDLAYLLRGAEICASLVQLPPEEIYTLDSLLEAIRKRLPMERAQAVYPSLEYAGITRLLLSGTPMEPAMLASLLSLALKDGALPPEGINTALAREIIAACFLASLS